MQAKYLYKIFHRDETKENWHKYVKARFFKMSVIKKTKQKEYQESEKKACQNSGIM